MATKSAKNRKPIASSTKGLICLVVLCVLTVLASCLSVAGMPLDAEGVNILLPWVPVSSSNWPKSLPLDKALGGGTYTEYTYTLPEGVSEDAVDSAVKTIKTRLQNMGETDAAVTRKDGVVRMEVRSMDSSLLNSKRSMAVMQGHFVFSDTSGNEILTEKDIADAKMNVNRLSSTSTSYSVALEFSLTKDGQKKLADADPAYMSVTCDGETISSYASVSDGKVTASLGTGDSAYTAASNYAFLARYGSVDVNLTQSGTGNVFATGKTVLTVIIILCAILLVCALVYLVMKGKLTGVSAFLAVWCTVVLSFFFLATVVIPSSTMLNVSSLVALLLGVLLAIYTAVTRTEAISNQITEGSAPKQATKIGMKAAAKNVWIAHGAVLVVSLVLMIFAFSRTIGYALCTGVIASAICTLVMRAFQLCFTTITNKPSLFGKTK